MAKKNKRKKGALLPKRVAGIKIPKKLRKRGADLVRFAEQPLVKELVAVAAVALATRLGVSPPAVEAGDTPTSPANGAAAKPPRARTPRPRRPASVKPVH